MTSKNEVIVHTKYKGVRHGKEQEKVSGIQYHYGSISTAAYDYRAVERMHGSHAITNENSNTPSINFLSPNSGGNICSTDTHATSVPSSLARWRQKQRAQ